MKQYFAFQFTLALAVVTVCCYTTNERAGWLLYAKDARTGLCFAMSLNGAQVTNVPCTPEVERLLETE
jgi:hypothetical protein